MKDITLVAIEFQWYDLTRYAIERSLEHIDAKEVLIISDKEILSGAKHVHRDPVKGIVEYNHVMLKEAVENINTEHALYVQWDGIANDKTQWTDEFLKYDYIGAVWPWEREGFNVGNGGFSLRSKRLLEAAVDPKLDIGPENDWTPEDKLIGHVHRTYLETNYGIKFPPSELARQFSFELGEHTPSFGFHGLWNVFNFMTDADMDYFTPRIDYKKWNHYKWHHVLAALIRRNRMDLYQFMLNQLIEHSPELIETVAGWLEADSRSNQSKLVIN